MISNYFGYSIGSAKGTTFSFPNKKLEAAIFREKRASRGSRPRAADLSVFSQTAAVGSSSADGPARTVLDSRAPLSRARPRDPFARVRDRSDDYLTPCTFTMWQRMVYFRVKTVRQIGQIVSPLCILRWWAKESPRV